MSNELEIAWKELETEIKSHKQIKKEEIMVAITKESKNPMERLKKAMSIKKKWCIFFTVFCLAGFLLSYNYPQAMMIWFLAFAYYGGGWLLIDLNLKKLETPFDTSIKALLKEYYQRISRMISIEEGVGAFVIPIFVVLGFMLYGIYDGDSIQEIFSDGRAISILLGLTIFYGAGGLIIAKKMNKKAFGKYLEQLKTNIDLLNTIDG